MGIEHIIFILVAFGMLAVFEWQFQRIIDNIRLGTKKKRSDRWKERLNRMLLVAFGQQKMFKRPIAAALHGVVYVGFLVINIEVMEIFIDGIFGTHRALGFLGPVYDGLMAINELLGLGVIVACAILLYRRNVLGIKRFSGIEMARWPKLDANIILITEIVLMIGLFAFNTGDLLDGEPQPGLFPVSEGIAAVFGLINIKDPLWNFNTPEFWSCVSHVGWWAHIVGILLFLNYLPYSKHFHIIMAFPNVYTSSLEPKGKLDNMDAITAEVKAMLDPAAAEAPMDGEMPRLGARDVTDLPWTNLMDAWTCTECGRCTDVCPANITGKKLSPRKIVMDTRDRLEEFKRAKIGKADQAKEYAEKQGKFLLGDYISPEELWACTTCNACVEACPVNIEHVSEIVALRRYMVMEEASAPTELNSMLTNIQNNGAPWPMAASARFDWAQDIMMPASKKKNQA